VLTFWYKIAKILQTQMDVKIIFLIALFVLTIVYRIITSKKRFISKVVKRYFYYRKKECSADKAFYKILTNFCPPRQRRLAFYAFGKVSDNLFLYSKNANELFLDEDRAEVKKLKYLIMTMVIAKQRTRLITRHFSLYSSLINRIYNNIEPRYKIL
jgi:hypothetical protein